MLGNEFYFGLIRKYVAVFGTLFNNIRIYRTQPGVATQEIKVPISYGPKEKTLARVEGDPRLDRPAAIVLPRMSFEISGVRYASERKLPSTFFKKYVSADGGVSTQYVPVPYDIDFTLSIMAKNAEDATKIVEQILPFFTPDFTPTVHLVPEMDIKMDIPIVLQSVNVEDQYEGDFEQRRAIIWTLQFVLKGYVFGPIRGGATARPVVKVTSLDIISSATNNQIEAVSVQPGLSANGNPASNESNSIPPYDINPNDAFGFIVKIE